MTPGERQRTRAQVVRMSTKALKEMASMMERANVTEGTVLWMVLDELDKRRVNLENVQAGTVSVDTQVAEMRHRDLKALEN